MIVIPFTLDAERDLILFVFFLGAALVTWKKKCLRSTFLIAAALLGSFYILDMAAFLLLLVSFGVW